MGRFLAKMPVRAVEMILGHEFMSKGWKNMFDKHACSWHPSVCTGAMQHFVGPSIHWNTSRLPVYLSQLPAGTSVKDIGHFIQGAREEKSFGDFNYGGNGNLAHYGQRTPPQYDLSSIRVPIVLATGGKDVVAGP